MMKSRKFEIANSIIYILLLLYNAIWYEKGIDVLDNIWFIHNHFMIYFCLYWRYQLSVFGKICMYFALARCFFRVGVTLGFFENVVSGPHFVLLGLIGVFALIAEYRTK